MGGRQHTKCILCGESAFQQIFALNDELLAPQLDRFGDRIGIQACVVLGCNRCGLAFREDLPDRKIEILQVPGTLPVQAVEGLRVVAVKAVPEPNLSPLTGLEEIEEIGQFRNPPGALLTVGNDRFDILETARLYGWCSSVVSWSEEESFDQYESSAGAAEPELQYDVVRLEGSLERAEDPFAFLDRIGGRLNRNGLMVVSMPDFDGWNFPIYGQGTVLEPIDLQKWYFTPAMLERLLITGGYQILRVSRFTAIYQLPHVADLAEEVPAFDGSAKDLLPPGTQRVPSFRVFARRNEKRAAYPFSLRAREFLPDDQMEVLESQF